jgi:EPS-associated MarR family transcriptional regulator
LYICVQFLNTAFQKPQKMDKQNKIEESEEALFVLREIERNPKATQRDLSRNLEISLGKINFLINSLIKKGIIEIKNFKNNKNKLAYMYLLTPQGIKTKLDLTHKFFILKSQEYERLKEEVESLKKVTPSVAPIPLEKETV